MVMKQLEAFNAMFIKVVSTIPAPRLIIQSEHSSPVENSYFFNTTALSDALKTIANFIRFRFFVIRWK